MIQNLIKHKMKTIITGLLLVLAIAVQAQEFSYTVKGNATETTVWINQLFADIEIEGNSGSEIRIIANGYEGLPDKAKGLKPLSGGGPENTGIGLSIYLPFQRLPGLHFTFMEHYRYDTNSIDTYKGFYPTIGIDYRF